MWGRRRDLTADRVVDGNTPTHVGKTSGDWPDETLSSRCGRWSKDGVRDWPRRIIDGLPFWKAGHCLRAYEGEKKRLQCPPELRRMYGNQYQVR